ncbi:sulfotransferase family protein [Marimonas lutisalis]|uniref:sulfotransferase family protein n=1 Tax=Marimonas lutisalis TaxID=2545756 RepID=UPI0013764AD6|nr:sulfotransferase family protein [Marimonas lutisalis]
MTPSELFRRNRNRWDYATWFSLDKGFFYVETPKVACTKIKLTLQEISGFPIPRDKQQIHYRREGRFVGSIVGHLDTCDEILASGMVYSFSFVRNPVDRLVSAYKDKIVRSRGPFWEKYRMQIRNMLELDALQDVRFEHFLNWVEETPDNMRDIHWRSQYNLLKPDIISYDKIGKQENFNSDFLEVMSAIGVRNADVLIDGRENATHEILDMNFNESIRRRIQSVYAKDFEFFNY